MQLRQLPFTELKIDRFFVTDAPHEHDSALIVRSIIDLAHGLGLSVTAEGVETPAQLRLLRALDCDIAQGYLVSQPVAPDLLPDWYGRWQNDWPEMIGDRRKPRADPTGRRTRHDRRTPETNNH
jgi:EAL domain-containing protein (putative c-di-GMP-specific phosphodiesterase class I)